MRSQIGFDMGRLEHAAAIADQAVQGRSHPTALIAVANSSELVWSHVVPGDDGVTLDSIFLLMSITKPVVATAVMRLVEQGRLLLNVPVASYIPEFAVYGKERVTPWHLLTHTSGIEESRWWEELSQQQVDPPASAFLEAACRSYLRFEPGTRCEYSGLFGFLVLGELITRLGGQPYPEFMRQQIFAPLGMRDTAFQPVSQQRAVAVHDMGGQENVERFSGLATPGGGLWSTAADLVTFGQTFLNGGCRDSYRLIGPAALEVMTRNHTPGMLELKEGQLQPFNYGLGWGKLGRDGAVIGSERSHGHGGATGTYFWVDPFWDLVFVFLTNRLHVEHDTPRRALNAVYGALEMS